MSFPARREHEDERGLFVVQDPNLRSRILPLFSFDPRSPSDRPDGHGTAFRIDPWGGCATAFHVIEDLLTPASGQPVLRKDIRLAALEFEGIGYGRVALPADSWRPFSGMNALCGIETPPFAEPRIRNVTELAYLEISRSGQARGEMPYLPLDLRRWRPVPGERVMALGFADLDREGTGEGDARAMTQYMYGSEAEIIEVQGPDGSSGRPWPVFRVEAEWPGGMSGGPVFNEAGNVIGLVSTGLVGAGVGTATYFSGWDLSARTFPSLDPSNPGSLRCWAAFDEQDDIVGLAPAREMLEPLLASGQAVEIGFASADPSTGGYLLL